MKMMLNVVCFSMICAPFLDASPKIFSGGKQLHDGMGDEQASAVYEFRGSYALRWVLRDVKPRPSQDPLADYWKPHTTKNPPWVRITVVDAANRKVVASEMTSAWEAVLQVQTGGKHYLVVTGEQHVAWTVWGMEGILAADREGIRKAGAEDIGEETIAAAATKIKTQLKVDHSGPEKEIRLNAVSLIESRSSSAQDFLKRWEEYNRVMGW